MIFALMILPIIAIVQFGGLAKLLSSLKDISPGYLDPLALSVGAFNWFSGYRLLVLPVILTS